AGGADVGNFVDLQPVDAASAGEDQDVGVGGSHKELLDEIFVAGLHAGAAGAPAALHAVGRDRRALQVAGVADRDRGLPVGGEGLLGIELGRAAGGVDLNLLATEVRDQILTGIGAVGAGANDGDHVIEVIERGQVAFENVLAILRLGKQVGSAAAHDFDPVV